jgi:hypothetical protein
MVQIRITNISGGTYPINVFLADVYGNNQTFLGTIDPGPVPPAQQYNSTIPSIFETAPEVMLLLVDDNNCSVFKILDCTFGCAFEITIELASCVVDITIQESTVSLSTILI